MMGGFSTRTAGGALRADCIKPLLVDFDVLNMVAVMPRNRYLHAFIVLDEAKDAKHQPQISVADESESEHEEGVEQEEAFVQVPVEEELTIDPQQSVQQEEHVEEVVVEDEEPGYKADFVDHEYDLKEEADSDADIQVNIDFGVDRNMDVNAEQDDVYGALFFHVPVLGVGDEANDDESEYGVADELHRTHGSDEDGDSNWTEFNTQTDMVNP
ncbi:hypothetical protein PTKIN_Ptkin03bG0093800 [Pterospermum kingtungense]